MTTLIGPLSRAVQIAPDIDTPTGTLDRVLAATAEAAGKGAQFVVFPETFVPWYPYFSFIRPPMLSGAEHIHLYDNAVVVPGPVTEAVASAARKHNIVVALGVNERDHGSLVRGMRANRIVVTPPALDDDLGFPQRVEDLAVEQLVAQSRIEALDEAVLPGAAGVM